MKRLVWVLLVSGMFGGSCLNGYGYGEVVYEDIAYMYNSAGEYWRVWSDNNISRTSLKFRKEIEYNKALKPVREIIQKVFNNRYNLQTVEFPDTLFSIGAFAFGGCSSLKAINLPSYPVKLGNYCFYGCVRVGTVTLPDSVSFGSNVFNSCSGLKTVEFQGTVKEVGDYVFSKCSNLTNVVIPTTFKADIGKGWFNSCTGLKTISIPYTVSVIQKEAFQNCTNLKNVNMADKVNLIYDYAFAGCESIESLMLPKELIVIRSHVFDNCTGLKTITLKEKIARIENSAFKDCSSLSKITIPAKVNIIEASAFEGCKALDSVTVLNEEPFAFGADAFKGISPTCVLMVPYGKRSAYIAAGWTEEVFKGGVKEIIPAGISQVKVKTKETGWYDLQGRKIAQPEKGHIYISGGKKVMK